MKLLEEHKTLLYDDQEKCIGSVYTQISRPSFPWFWHPLERGWARASLWVRITLSDGITDDTLLERVPTLEAARKEHRSRAWNYRMHLLGEDWP